MKLILLNREGTNSTTMGLLRTAAAKLGVEAVEVDDRRPGLDLDRHATHLLYRVAPEALRTARAIANAYDCVTFEWLGYDQSRDAARELAHVPMPPTETVRSLDPVTLLQQVERVGGFPVVIKDKIAGGHGAGVAKADNMETLLSIGRIVFETAQKSWFQIQEFLPHSGHARLIVLGDKVIDSIAYHSNDYDFRTNRSAEEMHVEPMKFPEEVERSAIRATHVSGYDFGGVDVILGDDGHKVLEVNYPCYFARAELCTGVPTSEMMIAHLLAKAGDRQRLRAAVHTPPPTLVLVNRPAHKGIVGELQKLARHRGVPVLEVNPAARGAQLPPADTYLLYRISTDGRGREIELFKQYDCTSLAADYAVLASPTYNRNRHYRDAGLPFVPKVMIVRREIGHVLGCVEEAGGFPALVASRDGDKTSFVRVGSSETYLGLVDYVLALGKRASVQPALDIRRFGRMVVLGDEVLSSIEYLSRDPEAYAFRDFDTAIPAEFPEAAGRLAVAAVHSHQLTCAAVNVVINADGEALVEDVVFPFDFRREQNVTGIDVGGRMLDALLARHAEAHR